MVHVVSGDVGKTSDADEIAQRSEANKPTNREPSALQLG